MSFGDSEDLGDIAKGVLGGLFFGVGAAVALSVAMIEDDVSTVGVAFSAIATILTYVALGALAARLIDHGGNPRAAVGAAVGATCGLFVGGLTIFETHNKIHAGYQVAAFMSEAAVGATVGMALGASC